MHAIIRSYHGVDQNRTAEPTSKVKETRVPKLSELPGFGGHDLADAGNGIFTSLGLFKTREGGDESLMPNEPRSRAARSSPATAIAP